MLTTHIIKLIAIYYDLIRLLVSIIDLTTKVSVSMTTRPGRPKVAMLIYAGNLADLEAGEPIGDGHASRTL